MSMYRVSLVDVPSPETEAYKDSLVNWLRFNHKDGFNALMYASLCLGLCLAGWGVDVVAGHLLAVHPHYTHTPGTLPPMKHSPLPAFKP